MILYGGVIRLVPEEGFGFIRDDAGMDWFFLADGVRGGHFHRLWVDERVGFVSETTSSGPRATDVHREELD